MDPEPPVVATPQQTEKGARERTGREIFCACGGGRSDDVKAGGRTGVGEYG